MRFTTLIGLLVAALLTTPAFAAADGEQSVCTPDSTVCVTEYSSTIGEGDCADSESFYAHVQQYRVTVNDGSHENSAYVYGYCVDDAWGGSDQRLGATANRAENGGWSTTFVNVEWFDYRSGDGDGTFRYCGIIVTVYDSDMPYFYSYVAPCPLDMGPPLMLPALLT